MRTVGGAHHDQPRHPLGEQFGERQRDHAAVGGAQEIGRAVVEFVQDGGQRARLVVGRDRPKQSGARRSAEKVHPHEPAPSRIERFTAAHEAGPPAGTRVGGGRRQVTARRNAPEDDRRARVSGTVRLEEDGRPASPQVVEVDARAYRARLARGRVGRTWTRLFGARRLARSAGRRAVCGRCGRTCGKILRVGGALLLGGPREGGGIACHEACSPRVGVASSDSRRIDALIASGYRAAGAMGAHLCQRTLSGSLQELAHQWKSHLPQAAPASSGLSLDRSR